jgi:hypothetical protein
VSRQTQCDAILRYLQTGRRITPMAALDRFGCFRLAARIHQLRERGHKIEVHRIKVGAKQFASYGTYILDYPEQ